jgi:uncharacterized protein
VGCPGCQVLADTEGMAHSAHKLIVNVTRRTVVCDDATIADRVLTRVRGLLGRTEMRRGEGLLLSPAPSIHTAFMRFTIDAIFLNRELEVIKLVPAMKPWRAAAARDGHAVLELEAGAISRQGICVGDKLQVLDLRVWDTRTAEVSHAGH